ncbi:MAG TPA: hypothetical protein VE175_08615, partial [Woeseiaceae bacterium]|nr:hypothetical protein [Woeseiaceae bacterium]
MATTLDSAAPESRSEFRIAINRAVLIQYGIAAVAFALVAAPLVPILYQSFMDKPLYDSHAVFTLDNFFRLFSNARFYEALGNSALLSLLTTIIATVIGVVTAVLVGRTNMPLRKPLGGIVLWPIYVSHLVLAFGWFMM